MLAIEGSNPMILKAMPKTSIIVKFLALLSKAWLAISDTQDLPSQLLFIAERRENGGIVLVRKALINAIMGSAARSLIGICS